MFEAAEVGRKLSKAITRRRSRAARGTAGRAAAAARGAGLPVIVLFAGVDGAGKGETVNLLNEWMDPRWIVTRGYTDRPTRSASARYWRYWRDLPPQGPHRHISERLVFAPDSSIASHGASSRAEFDALLDEIAAFERALTDDGALILKFWMHLEQGGAEEAAEEAREGSADSAGA